MSVSVMDERRRSPDTCGHRADEVQLDDQTTRSHRVIVVVNSGCENK